MSNLVFDGDWTVTLSNDNYHGLGDEYGVLTGNGKLACYVSMSNVGCSRTMVSGNVQFDQIGKYKNNTIEGFRTNEIRLFNNTLSNVEYTMVHQQLNMANGAAETLFEVSTPSQPIVDVKHTITPLRQYPYCILQTVEITPRANMPTLDVYHEMYANPEITQMDYQNNVIYNESIYADKGLYILNASGWVRVVDTKIAAASCYLFENTSNLINLGFNSYNDKSRCYQKHRFTNVTDTIRFHILSAQMTAFDFKEPLEEVKRILLNIAFKKTSVVDLVTQITQDNQTMWDSMWASDVEVTAKQGITEEELARLNRVRFFTRFSLFQVYACLREAVNTQINPLNLSYVDSNGNIFFDGDLWLTPLLIFLKPNIARVLLEFRYRNLEQALQLASSFGYKGSKYPYKNDVVGYTSVYWDVISPLHVFNNAAISINVWNYYRVTLDKEWLSKSGFIVMRNVADFLMSYIKKVNNEYLMENTLGMGNILSTNQAFTVYTAILALKYTIEACYTLGYIPKREWSEVILHMIYPTYDYGSDVDVVKYDRDYDGTMDIDILDNLFLLHPYYNSHYFNNYLQRNNSAITRNLEFYSTRIQTDYINNPLNNLIITSLYAVTSQTDTTKMSNFYDQLDNILNENRVGLWGYMNLKNDPKIGNDVSLSAFFVLLLVTCIGGLSIRGSTAPSNVITEQFRIQDTLGAYMPSTWYTLNISGWGRDEKFVTVGNQTPYEGPL